MNCTGRCRHGADAGSTGTGILSVFARSRRPAPKSLTRGRLAIHSPRNARRMNGGRDRDRTRDIFRVKEALYQLSYPPLSVRVLTPRAPARARPAVSCAL